MRRERRWIVLSDEGQHVTLGRETDPSSEEIALAGNQLRATGTGGWLAVMEGGYYQPEQDVTLMMVQEIAQPRASWEHALKAFSLRRCTAILPSDHRSSGPQPE